MTTETTTTTSTNAHTCSTCGKELERWQHRVRGECWDCYMAEQKRQADARSVPCAVCHELVDPHGSAKLWGTGHPEQYPLHWDCYKRLNRTAPVKTVQRSFWSETSWNRAELWLRLECGHAAKATRKDAKGARCRSCHDESVREQFEAWKAEQTSKPRAG